MCPEETGDVINNPYDDYELKVTFSQENGAINLIKSSVPIAQCTKYRYFEVEVLENKSDANIYVGIVDSRDTFLNNPI